MIGGVVYWFQSPSTPDQGKAPVQAPRAGKAPSGGPTTPSTLASPNSPAPPEAASAPLDSRDQVLADKVAEALTSRLRAGDLKGTLELSHPAMREEFKVAFGGDPARMQRAAALLATRRLKADTGQWAEYEVTEGGRTFLVVFERLGQAWRLRSL